MQKKNILFVYVNFSSFVKADYEILSSFADVTKYQFKPGKGIIRTGIELIREFIFLIFNVFKFDIVFIWFGDYHSLLPVLFAKLFRIKTFVVIGGYDVSTLSEFGYGAFSNPLRGFFTRNTFRYVSMCFPVAEALNKKLFVINPKAVAETIATIVDPKKFYFTDYQRSKRVITVSATSNYQRLMIKGLDRFRELATFLPDFEFCIIGIADTVKALFEPLPANLILIPPQDFGQLQQFYQNASFYAQLSRSEGLPNALCEAMLCGCIPVGTDVGDVGTAIGSSGLTVGEWSPERVAEFIRSNQTNSQLRDLSRERIITLYSPEHRMNRFTQIMNSSV